MGHVLLTTVGTAGDVVPFLRLGAALKSRGHAVTLASHCSYEKESAQQGLHFLALDDAAGCESFIQAGHLLNHTADVPKFLQRHILPQALEQCRLLESACTPETVVVSLSSPGIVGRLVAEKYRLPYVSVLMAPSYAGTLRFVEALLANFGTQINQIRASFDLAPVTHWADWWRAVDHYLALWPEWFGPCSEALSAPVSLTGFLWQDDDVNDEVPNEIAAFLAGKAAPILITGGTGVFGGDVFFCVSLKACQQLDRPAILVARLPEILPAALPENVRWFGHVPSLTALVKRSAVVIHHGGMGTLSQTLAAGVPHVILAAGGDRPDNAAIVKKLGAGEFLPRSRWQAQKVLQALSRVLTSQAVAQRCREIAGRLQNANPLQVACGAIETMMEKRQAGQSMCGSRGKPPAANTTPKVEELRRSLKQLTPQQQAFLMSRLRHQQNAGAHPADRQADRQADTET